ncbi:MAG TPA: prolyl oligopeptidase family serine peptidase [Sphingomonadaceae bacterium]
MFRTTGLLRALASAACLLLAAPMAAAESPPPTTAYGELPRVETAAISLTGSRIAVVGVLKGERRLLILDGSMNLLRAFSLGDIKLRGLQWYGDEGVLLTLSQTTQLGPEFTTSQFEAFRATIIPVDAAKPVQVVFARNRDIVTSTFGDYGIRQVNGQWYGYFGGVSYQRTDVGEQYLPHTRPGLFAVRLSDNSVKSVDHPAREDDWRDWLIDADGKVAATLEMSRTTGNWTITGPTGKKIASGIQPEGDAGLVALGHDGTSLIYDAKNNDGVEQWYEIPLDGSGEAKEILSDENIDRIYTDPTNGRIIGYLQGGADGKPMFFDPAHQALADKVAKAFKNLHVTLADWTPDLQHLLVQTSGTGDSGSWYNLDAAQLHATGFGLERPEIGPEAVGPVSDFTYKAADGLDLDGVLTLPPGREPKNLPVIVFPHGGPADYDAVAFDWWAQAFASRGYAVFQPNFRGSTNRDEEFVHAGDGQWGRKMETDMSDGLAALARQGIVDPSRACIMGASYGGYAALAGVTLQHGLYRCAVSVAGVADLSLMYRTDYDESGQSTVTKRALLAQLGPRATFDDVSPRRFADKADAPILLIHGRDDTVVPFQQSEKMADALKDAHKPYELVDLGSEDHWLSRSETREKMLEAAMAFIEKHNPPD